MLVAVAATTEEKSVTAFTRGEVGFAGGLTHAAARCADTVHSQPDAGEPALRSYVRATGSVRLPDTRSGKRRRAEPMFLRSLAGAFTACHIDPCWRTVALLSCVALGLQCSGRPRERGSRGAGGETARTAPVVERPPRIVATYQGSSDFVLTLFDDCRANFDVLSDHHIHYSERYAFDDAEKMIWRAGKPWAHVRHTGEWLEIRAMDGGFWDKVEGHGWWEATSGHDEREIPTRCRCASDACRSN